MDGSTARGHDAPTLHLEGFEGPLDLLLDLARRQQVDLARILITILVDQYVTAVTEAAQSDLLQAADWLVMAACGAAAVRRPCRSRRHHRPLPR